MENDQEQEKLLVQAPVGVATPTATAADGLNGPFPAELDNWNWGAFLLTWIWALGNHVWIGLLVFASIIPFIGGIIALVMLVLLGMKGNEWAWKAKKWDSIEHFKAVQKKWAKWGVIVLIVSIVLAFIIGIGVALLLVNALR